VDPGKLVELMARDKKALGDLTFVLDGPRGVEVVRGVPRDTVTRVLCELAS
jgi:5-deoxy-5-amino-3-dehydroquinate synthase